MAPFRAGIHGLHKSGRQEAHPCANQGPFALLCDAGTHYGTEQGAAQLSGLPRVRFGQADDILTEFNATHERLAVVRKFANDERGRTKFQIEQVIAALLSADRKIHRRGAL